MGNTSISDNGTISINDYIGVTNHFTNYGNPVTITTSGAQQAQYLQWNPYCNVGGMQMYMFDPKKPFFLAPMHGGPGECFATIAEARAEAERKITGDKSNKFVIFKAFELIEPEPVKTRTTAIK